MSTLETLAQEMHRKNQWHLDHPQVGDFWHEMYSPVCEVVEVREGYVAIAHYTTSRGAKVVEDGGAQFIQGSKPHWKSLASFRRWLSYSNIEGTWADVIPADERRK